LPVRRLALIHSGPGQAFLCSPIAGLREPWFCTLTFCVVTQTRGACAAHGHRERGQAIQGAGRKRTAAGVDEQTHLAPGETMPIPLGVGHRVAAIGLANPLCAMFRQLCRPPNALCGIPGQSLTCRWAEWEYLTMVPRTCLAKSTA
jgi:hypothetical protein